MGERATAHEVWLEAFLAYYPELLNYAKKFLGNRDTAEAEDLVMEVFCHAMLASTEDGSAVEDVKGYLFKCLRNALCDHVRHRKVRDSANEVLQRQARAEMDSNADPLDEILEGALRQLDSKLRLLVSLRYWDGHNCATISTIVGYSRGYVRNLISKALKALRKNLSSEDMDRFLRRRRDRKKEGQNAPGR